MNILSNNSLVVVSRVFIPFILADVTYDRIDNIYYYCGESKLLNKMNENLCNLMFTQRKIFLVTSFLTGMVLQLEE